MKPIRCNLTKACRIFRNLHRIIILDYGDTSFKISRNFTFFIEELYARPDHGYMLKH